MSGVRISHLGPECVDERCSTENTARKCGVFIYLSSFSPQKVLKTVFSKNSFSPRQATFSRCSRLILWTDATRTPKHGCFTLAATWRISLLSHIWAKKSQRKRMHASGVRPLPLAPRPRWAAWSYYSSANIALPWHCSSLWQGISPFHQRTMPYSGKKGEESQESLSWSDQQLTMTLYKFREYFKNQFSAGCGRNHRRRPTFPPRPL